MRSSSGCTWPRARAIISLIHSHFPAGRSDYGAGVLDLPAHSLHRHSVRPSMIQPCSSYLAAQLLGSVEECPTIEPHIDVPGNNSKTVQPHGRAAADEPPAGCGQFLHNRPHHRPHVRAIPDSSPEATAIQDETRSHLSGQSASPRAPACGPDRRTGNSRQSSSPRCSLPPCEADASGTAPGSCGRPREPRAPAAPNWPSQVADYGALRPKPSTPQSVVAAPGRPACVASPPARQARRRSGPSVVRTRPPSTPSRHPGARH